MKKRDHVLKNRSLGNSLNNLSITQKGKKSPIFESLSKSNLELAFIPAFINAQKISRFLQWVFIHLSHLQT